MLDLQSDRFKELDARYVAVSGERLPMEMISHSETYENLERYISECEKAGKDLLPEIYGWDFENNIY
jgi:biotin carboxylase